MFRAIFLILLTTYAMSMTRAEMKLCMSEESFKSNLEAVAPTLAYVGETFSKEVSAEINESFVDKVENRAMACGDIFDIAMAYEKELKRIKSEVTFIKIGGIEVNSPDETSEE